MTLKTINKSGRENYVSPSVEVLDVMSEGVFCTSFDSINFTENLGRDTMEEL